MHPDRSRSVATLALTGIVASLALLAILASNFRNVGPVAPTPGRLGLGPSAGVQGSASPEPPAISPPSGSPGADTLDDAKGIAEKVLTPLPDRIELYTGAVSVVSGQPITLHVSTTAVRYDYRVERLDATRSSGGRIVARSTARPGRDYRSRATFDSLTRTARANWPVTDTVDTNGWLPGVYVVTATDTRGKTGQAIFVVRTPVLRADQPAFVFPALTEQAYNLWGGANLYAYRTPRAVRVSFERPNAQDDGKGLWGRGDDRILAWLQVHGLPLQYTTDYDLSMAPPTVAPRLLIFGHHSEYVGAGLYDFVERHVNVSGDMNVLNFGANSFYWQIRQATPATPGAPMDIICYRNPTADPLAKADPGSTTTRWRDPPLDRPEGRLFGAQYVGVLGDGHTGYDDIVSAQMPEALLAGTGWHAGTVISGLLLGEGDLVYPGSDGIAIMDGHGLDTRGRPLQTSVTIRTSGAGARVFDAGTFAWGQRLTTADTGPGLASAGFDRFNLNVLTWLGFPATR